MNQGEDTRNQEELVSENRQEMSKQEEGGEPEPREENAKAADSETETNEELLEMKDKYLRLYSEFENFRRRTSREKLDMIQSANEHVIKSLLPVLDDFERAEKAVAALSKEPDVTEGFILIQSKLKKILDQFGLKTMEIGPGSDFDADSHEAITQIPAAEEKLKGKIVDVVEKGYLLNDKVIRYAKVVVGN